MCTEFVPECALPVTTSTTFAGTVLSTPQLALSVVAPSNPSQKVALPQPTLPPSPAEGGAFASPAPPGPPVAALETVDPPSVPPPAGCAFVSASVATLPPPPGPCCAAALATAPASSTVALPGPGGETALPEPESLETPSLGAVSAPPSRRSPARGGCAGRRGRARRFRPAARRERRAHKARGHVPSLPE
jgi:hypothetical protein